MVQEFGVSQKLNDVQQMLFFFFVACPATEKTAGFFKHHSCNGITVSHNHNMINIGRKKTLSHKTSFQGFFPLTMEYQNFFHMTYPYHLIISSSMWHVALHPTMQPRPLEPAWWTPKSEWAWQWAWDFNKRTGYIPPKVGIDLPTIT